MKTGTILDSCVLLVIKLSYWKVFWYLLCEGKSPTFFKWGRASEGGILFVCQHTSKQPNCRQEGATIILVKDILKQWMLHCAFLRSYLLVQLNFHYGLLYLYSSQVEIQNETEDWFHWLSIFRAWKEQINASSPLPLLCGSRESSNVRVIFEHH